MLKNKMFLCLVSIIMLCSGIVIAEDVELELLGRYNSGAGFVAGGAEIVVYDHHSQRAFIANGKEQAIDIVDLSVLADSDDDKVVNLNNFKRVKIKDINIPSFVPNDVTSVAVHPNGKFIAAAVTAIPETEAGRVVVLNQYGELIKYFTVGSLPDMVAFTPNGEKIVVAIEGEPNDDYSVDPVGAVSVIDISKGVKEGVVTNILFDGLKKTQVDNNLKLTPNSTLAKDVEPEYLTISADSKTAYVTLQEVNAIAKVDLVDKKIIHVHGLGFKDHSVKGNELDASNKDGKINIRRWPVLGMYQPDTIDMYTVDGKEYIVTANEGDSSDYPGYSEEVRVKDLEKKTRTKIKLNAKNYKGYTQKQLDKLVKNGLFDQKNLGRLKISTELGKNSKGEYEALYSYGARSFTIWDAEDMSLVYDSGSDFAKILAKKLPKHFNTDNDETKFDSRSDDKGVEPESLALGKVEGRYYAFVGLERTSGIMIYDITDPRDVQFVDFYSTRDYSVKLQDYKEGADIKHAGDIAPECIKFVPANKSMTGDPLLIVSHEVSGTVVVFEID